MTNDHTIFASQGRSWRGLHCVCYLVFFASVAVEAPFVPTCDLSLAEDLKERPQPASSHISCPLPPQLFESLGVD